MYDMKNRNLIIIAIIAAFTFLNSCKDSFLEVAPKGSLAETTPHPRMVWRLC
jgi:hypothetical protein